MEVMEEVFKKAKTKMEVMVVTMMMMIATVPTAAMVLIPPALTLVGALETKLFIILHTCGFVRWNRHGLKTLCTGDRHTTSGDDCHDGGSCTSKKKPVAK